MNKYLWAFFIALLPLQSGSVFGAGAPAEKSHLATQWKQMYFLGLSPEKPEDLSFNSDSVFSWLSALKLESYISSGVPLAPKHLINQKGITAWHMMWFLVYKSDKAAFAAIQQGQSKIHIPDGFLRRNFGEHINWPRRLLRKYDLKMNGQYVFVVPFLVDNRIVLSDPQLGASLPQHEKFRIIDVLEFDDVSPENSLKQMHDKVEGYR